MEFDLPISRWPGGEKIILSGIACLRSPAIHEVGRVFYVTPLADQTALMLQCTTTNLVKSDIPPPPMLVRVANGGVAVHWVRLLIIKGWDDVDFNVDEGIWRHR
jgi:hypothetical protein